MDSFEHGDEVRHRTQRNRTGIVDREFNHWQEKSGYAFVYWHNTLRTSQVKESDLEAYKPEVKPAALASYWSQTSYQQSAIRQKARG